MRIFTRFFFCKCHRIFPNYIRAGYEITNIKDMIYTENSWLYERDLCSFINTISLQMSTIL